MFDGQPAPRWGLAFAAMLTASAAAYLAGTAAPAPRSEVVYRLHLEPPAVEDAEQVVGAYDIPPGVETRFYDADGDRIVLLSHTGSDPAAGDAVREAAYGLAEALRPQPKSTEELADRMYAVETRLADLRRTSDAGNRPRHDALLRERRELARMLDGAEPRPPRVEFVRDTRRTRHEWLLAGAPLALVLVAGATLWPRFTPQRAPRLTGPVQASALTGAPTVVVAVEQHCRRAA